MKRIVILPLCLLLLCGGCGKKSSTAANIQEQYSRVATAQMEAEVTFHTPQEDRSFTLQCTFTPEESTVTVTAPETVKGVTATVSGEELTIAYDGTRFFGWERQPGKDTIQGKLESVLSRLQGHPVDVTGAGRTDAGVHARAMTANVVLDVEETPETIRDYLNRYLPDTIAVREVKEASPRFHARYNALGKTYRYICFDGPVKPVFDRKYVTLLDYRPDVERMQQAAAYLTGEHDFASFCGNPRMKKSTVRLVDSITVERRKDRVIFTFHGTGFLQNMVRILVGTLLEVGRGYWEPAYVQDILAAKDRKLAGPTAPPEGLCLMKVDY